MYLKKSGGFSFPDGRFCLNVADIRSKYFYNNGNGLYRVPISADLLMLTPGFRLPAF